jgi:hypothetical protein
MADGFAVFCMHGRLLLDVNKPNIFACTRQYFTVIPSQVTDTRSRIFGVGNHFMRRRIFGVDNHFMRSRIFCARLIVGLHIM